MLFKIDSTVVSLLLHVSLPGQLSGVVQVPRRCPVQLSGVVQKLAY